MLFWLYRWPMQVKPDSADHYFTILERINTDPIDSYRAYIVAQYKATADSLKGDYKAALQSYQKSYEYYKKWVEKANNETVEELTIAYETKEKEQENEALAYENKLLVKQQKIDRYTNWGLMGAVLSLVMIAMLVVVSARQRQRQMKQDQKIMELERRQDQERFAEQEALLTAQKAAQEAETEKQQARNEVLQMKMNIESQQAVERALQISARDKKLAYISKKIDGVVNNPIQTENKIVLKDLASYLTDELELDESWKTLVLHFTHSMPDFFKNLRQTVPAVSPSEERLCAYIRLNLSNQEIADLENITIKAVFKRRQRLKEKMELKNTRQLDEIIGLI